MAKVVTYTVMRQILMMAIVMLSSIPFSHGQKNFRISFHAQKDDAGFAREGAGLATLFPGRAQGLAYIQQLAGLLRSRGYVTASIDSLHADSAVASVFLYVGERYQWARIRSGEADRSLLDELQWNEKYFRRTPLEMEKLAAWQDRILNHLENSGYPFAKVELDSIAIEGPEVNALMKITRGPLYKVDSIRVFGDVKINTAYLYRYLDIAPGSIYKKSKLQQISRKLLELPYLQEQQPWRLTMLGTGSILDLYLQTKKSNQVNVLIGLLPNNEQLEDNKLLLTGEATLNLKNSFGLGETIGLNWQRLQVQSQRLNLLYNQPFLFKSAFGVDFLFDLFKKDSSFVSITYQLGTQFNLGARQSGKVYILGQQSNLGDFDTLRVLVSRRLPENIDVRSNNIGLDYEFNNTDYRFNPRRGNALLVSVVTGTRKVKVNNKISALKDPAGAGFNYASLYDSVKGTSYQIRLKVSAARYLPLGRQGTLKLGLNMGLFSSRSIFRNELFQIGGYKLLRGFDEESIFASQYLNAILEYRYRIGLNSFLFVFTDYGNAANKSLASAQTAASSYWSTGGGMAFQTRAGIFNLGLAAGKRPVDKGLNFQQLKIHFGYVNFF